jgi:nitrite reductase/ring-hydroxylating ferredoxin subunit
MPSIILVLVLRNLYIQQWYNAFDAACPNQVISSCSTMTLKGINVLCPCDGNEYSLFTGQGGSEYPLKQYRVEVNGNVLRIYN